ncbi:MAG: hypothetical protein ACK47B_14765 [Armatimonadota bacterium]
MSKKIVSMLLALSAMAGAASLLVGCDTAGSGGGERPTPPPGVEYGPAGNSAASPGGNAGGAGANGGQ